MLNHKNGDVEVFFNLLKSKKVCLYCKNHSFLIEYEYMK